jgi:hypothetical protein
MTSYFYKRQTGVLKVKVIAAIHIIRRAADAINEGRISVRAISSNLAVTLDDADTFIEGFQLLF